jgi:hypothetical protein
MVKDDRRIKVELMARVAWVVSSIYPWRVYRAETCKGPPILQGKHISKIEVSTVKVGLILPCCTASNGTVSSTMLRPRCAVHLTSHQLQSAAKRQPLCDSQPLRPVILGFNLFQATTIVLLDDVICHGAQGVIIIGLCILSVNVLSSSFGGLQETGYVK